jgi:competence protein ComEC
MPGFSDRWAVALACATALGAWVGIVTGQRLAAAGAVGGGRGSGLATVCVALAAAGVALVGRRPVVLCVALAILAAVLAQRSLDGLHPPHVGAVQSEITLLSDPEPTDGGGVRVDARLEGKRMAVSAQRAAAAALDDRLAGERVLVIGAVSRPGPYERRVLHRHLAGRLRVDVVADWRPGDGVSRTANALRRTLVAGATSLPPRQRALLMGLVLGDDRAQPADLADAFQTAGLTHLLAVSGENVAFVLVLVRPVLVRLRFAPRLVVTLAVLAGFALLTRFEPSVLRATAMAAIAAFGTAVGRPSSGLRTLALALAGLLLCDPLLVTSLGFQLSVAGSAGIILGAAPLAAVLPGPRWLAAPLGVTGAAQLAVAPLLVHAFGPMTLVSLPANLLAVPAAGPVMMWGLTAGFAAGVVGGSAAALMHWPTRALLWWIEAVALVAARHPLGLLAAPHIAGLAAAFAARRWRRPAAAIATAVLLTAVVADPRLPSPDNRPVALGPGAILWQAGGASVVVLDGRATSDSLAAALRGHAVAHLDVAVVRTAAPRAAAVASTLRARWPALVVLAPAPVAKAANASTPPPNTTAQIGPLRLHFQPTTPDHLAPTITLLRP